MKNFHWILIGGVIVFAACAPRKCPDVAGSRCYGATVDRPPPGSNSADAVGVMIPPNTLTEYEERAGWRLLFDGKTFNGWRGLGYDTVPTAHWKIENGTIRKLADGAVALLPDGQPAAGGDLMTT